MKVVVEIVMQFIPIGKNGRVLEEHFKEHGHIVNKEEP